MAEQKTAADKAAQAQQKAIDEEVKVHENARQDTAKVAPVEDPASAEDLKGVRPATGTPPQVVEADPGVEVDNDLDAGKVRRNRGASYELESDDLLARAQARAPHLTADFVKEYGFTDNDLRDIADGLVPGPPRVGPIHNVDLHRTPGGWQVTPVGVPPEDVGKNRIDR